MKTKGKNITKKDNNLGSITLIVGLILLIPLILTIKDGGIEGVGWNWKMGDFLIIGTLLFSTGLAIDYALKKLTKPIHRILAVTAIMTALLLIWAELAVNAVSKLLNFLY